MKKRGKNTQAEQDAAVVDAIQDEIKNLSRKPPATFKDRTYALFRLWEKMPTSEKQRRRRKDKDNWFSEVPWMENGSMCRSMHRLFNAEVHTGRDCTLYWGAIEAGVAHSRCPNILAKVNMHLEQHPADDFVAVSRKRLALEFQHLGLEPPAEPITVDVPAAAAPPPGEVPAARVAPPNAPPSWLHGLETLADQLKISPADYMHRFVGGTVLFERQAAAKLEEVTAAEPTTETEPAPTPVRTRRNLSGKKRVRRNRQTLDALATQIHALMGDKELTGLKVGYLLRDYDQEHPTQPPFYPGDSENARAYICHVLATYPNLFHRVRKGVYKAKERHTPAPEPDGRGRFVN